MIEINGKNILEEGKHVDRSHDVIRNTDKYTLYQVYSLQFFNALRTRFGQGMDLPDIEDFIRETLANPDHTIFVVVIRGPMHLTEEFRFLFVIYDRTQGPIRNRNILNAIAGNKEKDGYKWNTLTGEPDFFSTLQWATPPRHERNAQALAKVKAQEAARAAKAEAEKQAREARQAEGRAKIVALLSSGAPLARILRAMKAYGYSEEPESFLPDIVANNRLDVLRAIPADKVSSVLGHVFTTPDAPNVPRHILSFVTDLDMFKALESLGADWKSQKSVLYAFLNSPSEISAYMLANLDAATYTTLFEYLAQANDEDDMLAKLKNLQVSGLDFPTNAEGVGTFFENLPLWLLEKASLSLIYFFETILAHGADPKMQIKVSKKGSAVPIWVFGTAAPLLNAKNSTISDIKNKSLVFLRMLLDRGADPNVTLYTGERLLGRLIEGCRVCPAEMLRFVYDLKTKYGYRFSEKHSGHPVSAVFKGKTGVQFERVRAYVLRQERIETGTALTLDDELDESRKRRSRLTESLRSARQKYGETPAYFASVFDVSKTYKYTEWITKQLVNRFKNVDWTKSVDDLRSEVFLTDAPTLLFLFDVKQALQKFEDATTRNLIKEKDINMYKSLEDVKEALASTENQVSGRQVKMMRNTKGTQVVESTDRHLVLRILTYEAACAYGAGAKWCIASSQGSSHWDSYSGENTIYFILVKNYPFKSDGDRRKYHKFAVLVGEGGEDFQFFDAEDNMTTSGIVEKYSGFDPLELEYVEPPYSHEREFSLIMDRLRDLDTYHGVPLDEHLSTFIGDEETTDDEIKEILSEIVDNLIFGYSYAGDFDIYSAIFWADDLLERCPDFAVRSSSYFINTLLAHLVSYVTYEAFEDVSDPQAYYERFLSIINTLRESHPDAWSAEDFFSSVFASKRNNYDFQGVDPESFVAPLAEYAPRYLQELVVYVVYNFQDLVQDYEDERIFGFLERVNARVPLRDIKDEAGNTFADIVTQSDNQDLLNGLHDRSIAIHGEDPNQLKLELEARSMKRSRQSRY